MLDIVLIFSKVPVPGLVKTRLTQNTVLSEKDTALIAEGMLKDTISLRKLALEKFDYRILSKQVEDIIISLMKNN